MTSTNPDLVAIELAPEELVLEELAARTDEVDAEIVRLVDLRARLAGRQIAVRRAAGDTEHDLAAELATFHRYRAGLGADGTALAMLILHHQPDQQTEGERP